MRLVAAILPASGLLACCLIACTSGPEPGPLIEQARTAAKAREYESCYESSRRAAATRPAPDVAKAAFELGAYCHQKLYYRDRPIGDHVITSRWTSTEQVQMFEWASSFFDGETYPKDIVNTLLAGYPYPVWQDFQAFAETRPEIARYPMRVNVDNGIVQFVSIGDERGLRD